LNFAPRGLGARKTATELTGQRSWNLNASKQCPRMEITFLGSYLSLGLSELPLFFSFTRPTHFASA
jgi:hypothetical protein